MIYKFVYFGYKDSACRGKYKIKEIYFIHVPAVNFHFFTHNGYLLFNTFGNLGFFIYVCNSKFILYSLVNLT